MRLSETENPSAGAESRPTGVVVIGYGSPLRSDDAVGLHVAERVETWNRPGLRARAVHGLTPDVAATLAEAGLAVFVDARIVALDQGVIVERILPVDSIDRVGHTSDPRQLLALTGIVFGHVPEAYLVTIPAFETEIGERFSHRTACLVDAALQEIARLIGSRC